MNIEHINSSNFEEKVVSSTGLVLVDFFATWCMPCKMMGKVLEDIKKSSKDFEIYKVDIDENEDLSKEFAIMSVPTMILFKDGIEMEKIVGFRSKEDLLEIVEQYK